MKKTVQYTDCSSLGTHPGVNPHIIRRLNHIEALLLVKHPRRALPLTRPESHTSQDDLGNLESTLA